MTDYAALRLRAAGDPRRLHDILQQECRERYAAKLPREAASPHFVFPSLLACEQASSDLFAAWHATLIPEGARVLDLTAGLGIDTMHIARRAEGVVAVELDPERADALRHNVAAMGLHNVDVLCGDALQVPIEGYTHIFADPARRAGGGRRVYSVADCTPDLLALLPTIRRHALTLTAKLSPMLDVSHTMALLDPADIYVVGTTTECRELVAVTPGSGRIHAVTLPGTDTLTFTRREEAAAPLTLAAPQPGHMLYEPYPAVMKAAPFRLLCQRYGIGTLDANTHVYVSPRAVDTFPGHPWRIAEVYPFCRATLKALRGISAQVAVRNIPITADDLRHRLAATDSNDRRLLAVGTPAGRQMLVLQRP